jgi:glycosyltransferase involved in cell wall biosynthesis
MNPARHPKVSVVIPSYNHARFLPERIRSVLQQTFQDFEVLIFDDASTDDSRAVIDQFRDPRIRATFNERNSGSTFQQWNRGVAEARGEYVWLAESDDYADPEFLATLVDLLERHPNCGLAYTQSNEVDCSGLVAGPLTYMQQLHPTRWLSYFVASGPEEAATYLLHENTIPNASGVLFRREIYLAAGGANERMKLAGDWLMWAKLCSRSDVAYVARALNYFRMHPATVRAQRTHTLRAMWERYLVAGFILRHCPVPAAVREEMCAHLVHIWGWFASLDPAANKLWHGRIYFAARQMDPYVHLRWARKLRTVLGKAVRRMLPFAIR